MPPASAPSPSGARRTPRWARRWGEKGQWSMKAWCGNRHQGDLPMITFFFLLTIPPPTPTGDTLPSAFHHCRPHCHSISHPHPTLEITYLLLLILLHPTAIPPYLPPPMVAYLPLLVLVGATAIPLVDLKTLVQDEYVIGVESAACQWYLQNKMAGILQTTFSYDYPAWKPLNFVLNFNKICSQRST